MAATRDPSPEEIRIACAEIQSGWSSEDRMKRLRVDLRPTYQRCDGIREDIDVHDYNEHHQRRAKLTAVEDVQ